MAYTPVLFRTRCQRSRTHGHARYRVSADGLPAVLALCRTCTAQFLRHGGSCSPLR